MVDESKYMAVERKWRRGRGWGAFAAGEGPGARRPAVGGVAQGRGGFAAGGAVLIAGAKARGVADTAAVSAARMLLEGGADPCAAARTIASAQDAQLESCAIEDEDVTVTIRSPTGVPEAAWVARRSRAGPQRCDLP